MTYEQALQELAEKSKDFVNADESPLTPRQQEIALWSQQAVCIAHANDREPINFGPKGVLRTVRKKIKQAVWELIGYKPQNTEESLQFFTANPEPEKQVH